jgi:hypothetical protein
VGSTFKVLIRDSDSVESSKPAIAQEYILFTNAVRTCGRFKVAGIYQDLEACLAFQAPSSVEGSL